MPARPPTAVNAGMRPGWESAAPGSRPADTIPAENGRPDRTADTDQRGRDRPDAEQTIVLKVPEIPDPQRYAGLYIVDFGDHTAVGYTADEVATLLESERFRDARVYRIHRALPDGTMEIHGVPRERFLLEEAILFYCRLRDRAMRDFAALRDLARTCPPPCRAKLHLARLPGDLAAHVVALIYPAEYSHEMGQWLNDLDYQGGDWVEGGISAASAYYESGAEVLERAQLYGTLDRTARSLDELLASRRQVLQR